MDFLTITCHSAFNYGAVLQTYALYYYLTEKGLNGKVIDYQPKYFNKIKSKNILKKIIRPIVRIPDFRKGRKVFCRFVSENINTTQRISNINELKNNLEKAKVYITGSDQVWNCSKGGVGNDDAFFLSFVEDNEAIKTSYAASIAMNELNKDQERRFKELLRNFKYISVREKTGVNLLNDIGINNIYQVLDPVYLLSSDDWKQLVNKSKLITKLKKEKYILVYGFLQQKNVYKYAEKLANEKGYKIYNVNTLIEDYILKTDKYFWNVTPEDFLALIYYSQEVVTNSFHGLSFSLIFNKNFHLFGKKGNSSSRMFDMVDSVGLNSRIVKNDELIHENIDYDAVHNILVKKINSSKDYLEMIFKNI